MKHQQIPILDLKPGIESQWTELMASIQSVLINGNFILGPSVVEFEKTVATYLGVKHAIGLNSGTDALFIALRCLGVGPGDEVITSPFTFFATAEAISHVGATPVFVDIEPDTFNISVKEVARKITAKTKAVIPVHLFGQSADMDGLRDLAKSHVFSIVEDCAQAFGAKYHENKVGGFGDTGAFSFFPSKNLGTFGDGGLLVTQKDDIAQTARMLRAHGSRKKYFNEMVGYNSRLDEIHAAILLVRLKKIEDWNQGRRDAAFRYQNLLEGQSGLALPIEKNPARHVFHQYTVRILNGQRDAVQTKLSNAGISTMIYYPVPCHQLPLYKDLAVSCPEAERAAGEVISLPIWPEITEEIQTRVADALRDALNQK